MSSLPESSVAGPAVGKGLWQKGCETLSVETSGVGSHLVEHPAETVNTGTSCDQSRHCQQRVDVKAFTGRGAAAPTLRERRLARSNVDSVLAEMAALVALTLQVPGRPMYLCLHRRASSGQTALRWRRAGAVARHLPWTQVEAAIRVMPPAYAAWYDQVDASARALNAREIVVRRALAQVTRHSAGPNVHLAASAR